MQTGQNLTSLSHNALGFPGDSYGKESACNMGDQGTQSLGQEDLLEKGMATHSSILAWRIPWTEESEELTLINELRSAAPTYSLQESGDLSPSTCNP